MVMKVMMMMIKMDGDLLLVMTMMVMFCNLWEAVKRMLPLWILMMLGW